MAEFTARLDAILLPVSSVAPAMPVKANIAKPSTKPTNEPTAREPLVVMRAVDPVGWNVADSCFGNAVADSFCVGPNEFFPAIRTSVSGVDISCPLINEEDPKRVIAVVTSCRKEGVVFFKYDEMVKNQFLIIEFNHFAPPIVVMRAPKARVNPPEVCGVALAPSLTTLAASVFPATEETGGWVKLHLTEAGEYIILLIRMKAILTEGRKRYLSRIAEISFQIMFAAAFLTEFFAKLAVSTKILIAFCIIGCVIIGFIISPERNDRI